MDAYGYNRLQEATAALEASRGVGSNKEKKAAIEDWHKVARQVFDNRPEEFQAWTQENPEMAIRFHARAAVNSEGSKTLDPKQHDQMAKAIALGHGMQQGYGQDMKENGRMLATDYKTFKDVNSEWGPGDFWKIGTMQTIDKGFGAFVDSLDLKDVAMMAAPFIAGPLVGPMIAQMGLNPAMSAALSGALMEGIQGGDLEDIIMGGGKGWLGGQMANIFQGEGGFQLPDWLPEGTDDIFAEAKDLFGDVSEWGQEKWDQFGEMLPEGVGDFFGNLPDWMPEGVPGFGDSGGEWLGDAAKEILGGLIPGAGAGMPGGQGGVPAQGMMMAPREPAELAKLNAMPQLAPTPGMQPWIYNPQGMMG